MDIFAPLQRAQRLTVVPGNHDRTSDDAGHSLMAGRRVDVVESAGLFLVRIDSTAAHNRSTLSSHGEVTAAMVEEVEAALLRAPAHSLRVLLLHHHPLALPRGDVARALERAAASSLLLGAPAGRGAPAPRPRPWRLGATRPPPRSRAKSTSVPPESVPWPSTTLGARRSCVGCASFSHADGELQGAARWLWAEGSAPDAGATAEGHGGRALA